MNKILSSRLFAWFILFLLFVMQSGYAVFTCHNGLMKMWLATTITLSPAIAAIFLGSPLGSISASLSILPFVIWANYWECMAPYSGRGAPMAYAVVWLYGIPFSTGVALFVARKHSAAMKRVNERENNKTMKRDSRPLA